MRKVRLLLLTVVALVAVTAMTTSSASAAFTLSASLCNGGKVTICWDKEKGTELKELVGTEPFSVKQEGKGLLEGTVEGQAVHLECTETKVKEGLIEQTAPLVTATRITGVIVFENCKAVAPTTCTIEKVLTTVPVEGTASVVGDIEFKPVKGTEFIKIKFTGVECLLAGPAIPVTGKVEGLWAAGFEEDLTLHTLNFVHKDEGLFFGKNKAGLELTLDVTIPGLSDPWDVALG